MLQCSIFRVLVFTHPLSLSISLSLYLSISLSLYLSISLSLYPSILLSFYLSLSLSLSFFLSAGHRGRRDDPQALGPPDHPSVY